MPVRMSPIPALAIPGFPDALIHHRPSGAAITVPLPLRATHDSQLRCEAPAAARRSAWISAVVQPASRAHSAGCGVNIVVAFRPAPPTAGRRRSQRGSARRHRARAAARAAGLREQSLRDAVRTETRARRDRGERRIREELAGLVGASAPAERSRRTARSSATRPRNTLPGTELDRCAAGEDRGTDHPGAPPSIARLPASPLWKLRGRARSGVARIAPVTRCPAGGASDARSRSSVASVICRSSPVRPACSSPGFRAMNVMVCVARNAVPINAPVSALMPLGMSRASFAPDERICGAHELGRRAGERPHEADPEEPVDDEVVACVRRDRLQQPSVDGVPFRERDARIVRRASLHRRRTRRRRDKTSA